MEIIMEKNERTNLNLGIGAIETSLRNKIKLYKMIT